MPDESPTTRLERLTALLDRHGVEFLIIGGQAEWLFGSPRNTLDIDVCYRRTPENLGRLAEALREIKPTLRGAPPDLPFRIDAEALALGCNYTFSTPFGDVDFLGEVQPLGQYEHLLPNAESYRVGDRVLRTISLDDLIRVKRYIARAKDAESLYQLLAIKRVREETNRT